MKQQALDQARRIYFGASLGTTAFSFGTAP
jgi:hypothetical protein